MSRNASDENGHRLKYAGVEFSGADNEVERLLPVLTKLSLLLREVYHRTFGRADDALMLQHIPGRVFAILPYSYVERLLASGKRQVQISRVIVSTLAYRNNAIFGEARVVLSSVLGSGEVRGSSGHLDAEVRALAEELRQAFKLCIRLHSSALKGS
jgi:hypothetical protein